MKTSTMKTSTMKTSTIEDITNHLNTLKPMAEYFATKGLAKDEEDIWESVVVEDMYFDFNIFLWEDDKGKDVLHVTVHPVIVDSEGYGSTDNFNFLRLVTKRVKKVK